MITARAWGWGRAALLAVLGLAPLGLAAGDAIAARWSPPFRVAGPASLDLIPPQIAFSAGGSAAVAFGIQNVDAPRHSSAYLAVRSPSGRIARARLVPGAQQVLDLAYQGRALELLTGTSPARYPCCGSASATRFRGGRFGRGTRLVTGLAGATAGRLLTVPGGIVATVATERGVWAAGETAGRFGRSSAINGRGQFPEALGAAIGSGNRPVVAWSARTTLHGDGPSSIFVSRGSPPRGFSRALRIGHGHRIAELALARNRSDATVAWIETWFDGPRRYRSQAMVADLGRRPRARRLSGASAMASGLAFAANGAGAEELAWRECSSAGTCALHAALRSAGGRFRASQTLGAIDPGQMPAAAVGANGVGLVGWIDQGEVRAAAGRTRGGRYGAESLVSGTRYAADLSAAFGPRGRALLAWIDGTFSQSVIAALYH